MPDIQYRAAREEELETCVGLQHRVFRPTEPDAPARYRCYVTEDPGYRLEQTRVAVHGDQIVGHLRVWDRILNVRGVGLLAGGVGSLLTLPEHRGQGIGSGLLADAEQYFAEGYELGLLFSIIGTPYYDARGWTPLALPTFELAGVEGSIIAPQPERLSVAGDLTDVRALYEVERTQSTGACERNADYWDDGPARLRGVFPRAGVRRDGRLVAYANWDVGEDELWVQEACAFDEEENAYEALASAVVSDSDGKPIEGSLRSGHPIVGYLERETGGKATWSRHDEMMVKIADWERLREKLATAGIDVGTEPPTDRAEADAFWRVLMGRPLPDDRETTWWDRMGECAPLFYAWVDIF